MHLKRNKMPKTWPLKRKGTKYLVRPSHSLKNSIPLLILLRDMLKIVKDRKEAKKIINLGKIKVNCKKVRDEKISLSLFDIVDLDGKKFKLILKNKKFNVDKVEREEKIVKIVGKKILKGSKLQVNLSDGRNYVIKEKLKTGDSVVIDLKENKIKEVLEFKPGCKVLFMTGKHLGEGGVVEIKDKNSASVKIGNEKINSRINNLMVIK